MWYLTAYVLLDNIFIVGLQLTLLGVGLQLVETLEHGSISDFVVRHSAPLFCHECYRQLLEGLLFH